MKKTSATLNLIKLIHVAKRDLSLDEDTYRDLLTTVTGKNSLKELTVKQLEAVVARLKQSGFKVRAKAQNITPADDPQSKMIRALWLQLHTIGAVKSESEYALCKFVESQTGISALQFLNTQHASQIIESMKQWIKRVNTKGDNQ